jgi:hypothetical protein
MDEVDAGGPGTSTEVAGLGGTTASRGGGSAGDGAAAGGGAEPMPRGATGVGAQPRLNESSNPKRVIAKA